MDLYGNGLTLEYLNRNIPITFPYRGKTYNGEFSFVQGAGGLVWHLMVKGFYWGQLFIGMDGQWRFGASIRKDECLTDMAQYFGDYVMLYLE